MGAACLQDDYEHGYTIFDDPKKVFATGYKADPEAKKQELKNSEQWGKMDEIQFRARVKIYIES